MASSCRKLVIFPQGLWRECRPTNIMLLDSGLQNSERINYHCFIAPPQTFIGLYFYIKASIVEAMVSPVVMYGCESRTAKKAEYQRIDAFELWHWRKVLRVPQTARRSNQSIPKDISPEYSLGRTDAEAEAPILWPPDANSRLTGKDPDGKTEGKQRGE